MTLEQAKAILLRHKPGRPPEDEEMRQALAVARDNPELQQWLEAHHDFHRSFGAVLGDIQPPPDLRERILAGRKIVSPPAFRRPSFIAAAAAAAVLFAVGLLFLLRPPGEEQTFALFQSRMVGFALREYRMDIETPEEAAVRRHLAASGSPSGFPLPAGLASLPVKGGASFTWKGEPVSMLCFDWQGDEILYLFVIDQGSVDATLAAAPSVAPYKGVSTAAWTNGDVVYLLVGKPAPDTLRALL